MLFVMMLARFCVIQWPITSKFRCETFNKRITLAIIVGNVSCCFIVVISFVKGLGYYIPTGICFLLHGNEKLTEFILFTSLRIICVLLFCIVSNVAINLLTILALIKQKISRISTSLKEDKYNQIIIHLFIVIFSNMCYWIPSIVVFILSLVGYHESNQLLVWVLIIVVPINSVVNPILFSILTPTMIKRFSKICTSLKKSLSINLFRH